MLHRSARPALLLLGLLLCAGCGTTTALREPAHRPRPRHELTLEYPASDGSRRPLTVAYVRGETAVGRRSGELVILIHGLGTNADSWARVIDGLATHATVLAPDLPGCGWSDAPRDFDYAFEDMLAITREFTRRAPELAGTPISRPAILAGQSLGGGFAAMLAASDPARYRALILSAPAGYPFELPLTFDLVRSPVGPPLLALSTLLPGQELARPYLHRQEAVTDDFGAMFDVQRRDANHRFALRQIFRNTAHLEVARRHIHRVREIRTPVLLLWGEEDALLPRALADRWVADLPRCRLVLLPDTGHVIQEEVPERWLAEVRAFLGWEP